MAHGEAYGKEIGWHVGLEALIARIVADHAAGRDPTREAAWIAEVEGNRAGCIVCVVDDETTARLRILLVHPDARGCGLGGALVDTCVDFARAAGYRRITLWTNDVLVSARQTYQAAGSRLVESERHQSFGTDLVGQNWALDF